MPLAPIIAPHPETGEKVAFHALPNGRPDYARPVEAERDANERPAKSATKDEWVEHAETVGVETEGKTKDEIIAEVEAKEGS